MTIVELMIAFALFTLMSLGSLTALIQTRKMSENNVAQETAAVIAQGIIEQVQLNPYDDIQNKDDEAKQQVVNHGLENGASIVD